MRLRIASIQAAAAKRPEGYVEDVMSRGEVDGEWLEISSEAMEALRQKYRPAPPPPEPPVIPDPSEDRRPRSSSMFAVGLSHAPDQVDDAIVEGEGATTPKEIKTRVRICQDCPFYLPDYTRCVKGRYFLHTKLRSRFQHCPEGKW